MRVKSVQNECGFTLIEALVTLALAAIILPVTTRGILIASESTRIAREKIEAVTLAENKLNEIILTEDWRNGALSGDFSSEWPGYSWELNVDSWQRDGFRQLTVYIQWSGGGKDYEVAVSEIVRENY